MEQEKLKEYVFKINYHEKKSTFCTILLNSSCVALMFLFALYIWLESIRIFFNDHTIITFFIIVAVLVCLYCLTERISKNKRYSLILKKDMLMSFILNSKTLNPQERNFFLSKLNKVRDEGDFTTVYMNYLQISQHNEEDFMH
ncbi:MULTISPECIES: hypothetical protein [Bacillus cereus group]|uniref:Uncharacterized protein n=1 Tax=Bacillus mycoides TaxID=1405 RepID=A0A1G4ET37_BACMY|nr:MULTISPECIES: hypothetical protein [Bacillus cereus group]SCB69142.1 Uncharacterized protein BWGO95_03294 [Bacillus mycoides]